MERRRESHDIDPQPVIVQVPSSKPFFYIIVLVLIVQAFFLGSLWTKVEILQKGGVAGAATAPAATAQTAQTAPAAQTIGLDKIKGLFQKNIIKFGDANKKVLLVEVADPSCPYCHVAAGHDPELNNQIGPQFKLVADGGTYMAPVPEMKKLVDEGKAAFAYIYSPGHGNGEMGTKALYCAFENGKFWEVHDILMTNAGYNMLNNTIRNDKTKSAEIADFLKSAFDPAQMKSCIDSGKYDARLGEDTALATSLGVQGTPGFFINATNFAGAYSYKDMESAVATAMK